MTGTAPAAGALLLALAVLLPDARPGRRRLHALRPASVAAPPPVRPAWAVVAGLAAGGLGWLAVRGGAGLLVGLALGGGTAIAALRLLPGKRGSLAGRRADGSDLAAGWDLMATCLAAGLPVPAAAEAAAARIEGEVADGLRRVAGLLALGSAPASAWSAVAALDGLESFARAAQRSADTGAGLARVAKAEATRLRAALADGAEARAERAAVLIAAPLSLCFLPAFLTLGIAPVVIGLAGEVLARW